MKTCDRSRTLSRKIGDNGTEPSTGKPLQDAGFFRYNLNKCPLFFIAFVKDNLTLLSSGPASMSIPSKGIALSFAALNSYRVTTENSHPN